MPERALKTHGTALKNWRRLKQIRIPPQLVAPCFLAALFCFLAALTWRRWPDPLIDFGRELYTPWQLASGKILYIDLAHLFGPASQYFNAMVFLAFGASYTALIWMNLALTALETALIYAFFRNVADRLAATLCAFAFLLLFAFAQFLSVGNYNFISPYSHEATHGILVATLMIGALCRALAGHRRRAAVAAGLCLGTLFLMKQDIFISAVLVVVAWSALLRFLYLRASGMADAHSSSANTLSSLSGICLVAVSGTAVVLTAWAAFAFRIGPGKAFHVLAGYWIPVFDRRIRENPFYLTSMGLDHPGMNSLRIIIAAGFMLGLVYFIRRAAAVGKRSADAGRRGLGFCIATSPALLAAFVTPQWVFGCFLLPGTAATLVYLLHSLWQIDPQQSVELRGKYLQFALWCVFALGLMPRMLLKPRLEHYGFYLGMPACVALVAQLTYFLPLLIKDPEARRWQRAVFALLIGVFALRLAVFEGAPYYARKQAIIGSGEDTIRVYPPDLDPRTEAVQLLLSQIRQSVPPGASLAVLPEGAMLNYLSRRANPTPYDTFMLGEMLTFGESKILAALQNAPPAYIILIYRDTSEHGFSRFGSDLRYGQHIMEWVRGNYTTVFQYGNRQPILPNGFGAELLERQAPASNARL